MNPKKNITRDSNRLTSALGVTFHRLSIAGFLLGGRIMYQVAHHDDDGTEAEYWYILDDSTPGAAAIGETYDNEADCLAEVERLNEAA